MRSACAKVLIYILTLNYVQSQTYEGDLCTINSTGKIGICRIIESCQSAKEALMKQRIFPQTCGFAGGLPIVCCPNDTNIEESTTSPRTVITTARSPETTRTTSSTTILTTSTDSTPAKVGDKSKQKCLEYKQYVYGAPSITGLLGAVVMGDDECVLGAVVNIVGGTPAKPKEFPHNALLGYDGEEDKIRWYCGGSLISEKFVLTAQHCKEANRVPVKYVRLGELVISSTRDDAEPQDFMVKRFLEPPNRRDSLAIDDIALIELDGKADLNPYVRPACLNVNPIFSKQEAIAIGFGRVLVYDATSDDWLDPALSDSLLQVKLELFSPEECQESWKGTRVKYEDETHICAGSHNDTRDTCQGDSGGPLQIITKNAYCSYEIVGVTSYGKRCGETNSPSIYTRVSAYLKWIEDTVWP